MNDNSFEPNTHPAPTLDNWGEGGSFVRFPNPLENKPPVTESIEAFQTLVGLMFTGIFGYIVGPKEAMVLSFDVKLPTSPGEFLYGVAMCQGAVADFGESVTDQVSYEQARDSLVGHSVETVEVLADKVGEDEVQVVAIRFTDSRTIKVGGPGFLLTPEMIG